MVEILPEIISISVLLTAILAELFHYNRISRIKRLAFGPGGRPAVWTILAQLLRVTGICLACWGFASLWFCG